MTNVFPHGLRGVLPRACLPAAEAVVTADGSQPCLPVGLSLFVDTYVSAPARIVAPRDFTFKAVIGEPEW